MRVKVIKKELRKLDAKDIVGAKGTKRYRKYKRQFHRKKLECKEH